MSRDARNETNFFSLFSGAFHKEHSSSTASAQYNFDFPLRSVRYTRKVLSEHS